MLPASHSLVVPHLRQSCASRLAAGPPEAHLAVGHREALAAHPADRLDEHRALGGLDPLVQRVHVVVVVHRVADFASRDDWDAALARTVADHRPDLVVLAGFMKLVGESFLAAHGGRVVNTHPALSPSFPGMQGPQDALDYGVKVTGCTLFVVDDGVDTGAIVAQRAVRVEDDDSVESLHERIKVAERAMLVETIGRMAREGWTVDGRRVRLGG